MDTKVTHKGTAGNSGRGERETDGEDAEDAEGAEDVRRRTEPRAGQGRARVMPRTPLPPLPEGVQPQRTKLKHPAAFQALPIFLLTGCCRERPGASLEGLGPPGRAPRSWRGSHLPTQGLYSSRLSDFKSRLFVTSPSPPPLSYAFLGPWLLLGVLFQLPVSGDSGTPSVHSEVTSPLSAFPHPPPSQTPSPSRHRLQFLRALHFPSTLALKRLP